MGAIPLSLFQGFGKHFRGVLQTDLRNVRQDIRVIKVKFPVRFGLGDLAIDACFGMVVDPLAYKDLAFLVEEIGALAFTLVVDPLAFEMVAITASELAKT
jgi:hypothetical protein